MISIVGLGPGDPELITRRSWRLLTNAAEVWVRTRRHPAVAALIPRVPVQSYDYLYERHEAFDAVYAAIAADVVARGAAGDVVYATPGDPSVAEATTHLIRELAASRGIAVEVHPGVSFLEPSFAALDEDPIRGAQVVDATALAAAYHPPGSTRQGVMIAQLYSRLLAADVKLTLMNAYPDDHQVTLIWSAGGDSLRTETLPLYALDRREDFDDLTSLWVPPLAYPSDYNALQDVIAHLRSPNGCPWDREQTHESLRPYLLEETYEVLEAIDADDPAKLAEELGDLLIQVALHVQIATEEGEFKMDRVIGHVVEKLIRRHPHVFGDVDVADAAEVARNWETIKARERAQAGEEDAARKTMLDGIPRALPALALAQTYLERLARVGYPLATAAAGLDEDSLARALLTLVEQAQSAGLDAESALRRRALALRDRLRAVERLAAERGQKLTDLDPMQQRALWRDVQT